MSTKQIDDFARAWILHRSIKIAHLINAKSLMDLRAVVSIGLEAGESIQKITKRIEIYFDDNKSMRAKRVARTEVIAANNEGALHRYELEGIDKSEFYPAPDACDICLPYAGEIFLTKESHGIIPVHPSCRCVWLPVI